VGSWQAVHGSLLDPTAMDGWSDVDVDVIVNLTAPVPAVRLFGAEPWAFATMLRQ
jgi:hypothetical protein